MISFKQNHLQIEIHTVFQVDLMMVYHFAFSPDSLSLKEVGNSEIKIHMMCTLF